MTRQARYRVLRTVGETLAGLCLVLGATAGARASVAVLLEQPYGDLGRLSPSGHSAVYLDHICAASPTELRPCRPGELGVVLSRYDGITNHDWLAIPLVAYLYGVESADQIPATMDRAAEFKLRDSYRRAHLESVAPDRLDGEAPAGNWYELVGSAYDRTSYGFSVKTTAAQDAELIAQFNDRPNFQRYNGAFVNCADFVRVTINRFYPHAIRRNFIADLGMSSPKSVARGLAHYAKKHPETEFHTFIVPQVKGSLPRSHKNVDLAEGILKPYVIPIAFFTPWTAGAIAAAYIVHGRFAMPKDAPVLDVRAPAVAGPGDGVVVAAAPVSVVAPAAPVTVAAPVVVAPAAPVVVPAALVATHGSSE